MAEALGHLFNGKLREAVQTSIAVIKRSSNPKVGSDIKDPLLSTLEQISMYIPETGSVSDTEQQEIMTLVNTGVLGNIAYGAHKKMVDSRDLLETQSDKEREIMKEFPTQLYDLAIALGYQPVSTNASTPPSANTNMSPVPPAAIMNRPTNTLAPSNSKSLANMNRPTNTSAPSNSKPLAIENINMSPAPPAANMNMSPTPLVIENMNRSTNTSPSSNSKPLANMNRSTNTSAPSNSKPLAIMNRSTNTSAPSNSKALAINTSAPSNSKPLAIMNMNRSFKPMSIDTVTRTKELLKNPFSSLRNTFKKGMNVNSTRKNKAPLLLKDKEANVVQVETSDKQRNDPPQNIQPPTDIPGFINMKNMSENTNQKQELVPARKAIDKMSRKRTDWMIPGELINPLASARNRETKKREKQARLQAIKNVSKRVYETTKSKRKDKDKGRRSV